MRKYSIRIYWNVISNSRKGKNWGRGKIGFASIFVSLFLQHFAGYYFLHRLSSARKPDTCRSRKFQSADCFCRFKAGFPTTHRLRSPNETFFHRNPKLFGLGRQFGQINFGAFLVFLSNLLAPIFGTVNLLSMFSITYVLGMSIEKM